MSTTVVTHLHAEPGRDMHYYPFLVTVVNETDPNGLPAGLEDALTSVDWAQYEGSPTFTHDVEAEVVGVVTGAGFTGVQATVTPHFVSIEA